MPDAHGRFKGISIPELPWHPKPDTVGCDCGWTGVGWPEAQRHVLDALGPHTVTRLGAKPHDDVDAFDALLNGYREGLRDSVALRGGFEVIKK